MRPFWLLAMVMATGFLSACQSTQQVVEEADVYQYLYDDAFPDYRLFEVESPDQVFALDEEAKNFVKKIMQAGENDAQIKALMRHIFDRSEFNLLYLASANTVASETFHNKAANCLSMTIMTYAMAKEAGYSVRFQDIIIPEYWTRRSGYSVLNGHVNLVIMPRNDPNKIRLLNSAVLVDFDPQATRKHFPKRTVSKATILAMFYNNKGADALLANAYSEAYAYFRAAIEQDPGFDSSWVNLGFLYRLHEHYQYAEGAYALALKADNNNLTAWENLAYLYRFTDREAEARKILSWVENKRENNPFYHFILGEQEFEFGNYDAALVHYRRALQLDNRGHELYFGMAKAYFHLGDISRSQQYLKAAERKASNTQDQARYQGKLALFSRL